MKNTVFVVSKPWFGTVQPQDQRFGEEMLNKFFHTIDAQDEKPQTICFYTDGVKLTVEGSFLLPILKQLERHGVEMVICKTCLAHYQIEDQVQMGKVGGMDNIVQKLSSAEKVIFV